MTNIFLVLLYSFSISTSVESDVKYVWASKLNLRTKPSIDSEVVLQIPFGKILNVFDEKKPLVQFQIEEELEEKYSIFDKRTRRFRDSIVIKPMLIEGYWRKVIYENVEGYVFDFYLSKIPPLVENLSKMNLSEYLSKQSNFIKRNFFQDGGETDYTEFLDKENEIKIEVGIKGKGGYIGIFVKNISLEEGKMIGFQLFKNNVNGACGYGVSKEGDLVRIESYCSC